MQKSICRVVEIKGDGTDSDYIEFGPFDYEPKVLKCQFTPSTSALFNNWEYEYSMDGESWLREYIWVVSYNGDTSLLVAYFDYYNGGTFVRLPLAQFINTGYVGRLAIRVDFYN